MDTEKYRMLTVSPDTYKRTRMLAAALNTKIMDVVEQAITLLESQSSLPHPDGAHPAPVIETQP